MFLCISECVYVGNTKVKKRHTKEMPKRSTCNEWSQLEADTTGKPPSVRGAVGVTEIWISSIFCAADYCLPFLSTVHRHNLFV